MPRTKQTEAFLDQIKFGGMLRIARLKAGYTSVEDFASVIREQTGYDISKEAIYRIEKGDRVPRIDLYAAMQMVLYKDGIEDSLLRSCAPKHEDRR